MSGSLHKRRNPQKENQPRLSNPKLPHPTPSLAKFSPFELLPQKTTRKTHKLKTTRKHQMSVQYILQQKIKEPYTIRSLQVVKDKQRTKNKRKKKEKQEEQRFNIPVYDFSRSNSLIVFSQKDSTINHKVNPRPSFVPLKPNPHQAATLIQKTWRGYLTRKLLEQYIHDQQKQIQSAIHFLKSKNQSFCIQDRIDTPDDMDFSSFSQIHEETSAIGRQPEMEWTTGAKPFAAATTEHATNSRQKSKESPTITKNFFKHNRTQPDLDDSKHPKQFTHYTSRRQQLSIQPQVVKITVKYYSQPKEVQQNIEEIKGYLQSEWMAMKKTLTKKLGQNKVNIQEMAERSSKIKQIYEGSLQFMNNVHLEINAIVQDMHHVVQKGTNSSPTSYQKPIKVIDNSLHPPKSQMFTFQAQEQQNDIEPQSPKQHFSQGQIKLQNYLSDLLQDFSNFDSDSELEYLCQIIKINSERGVKTITERCLLQFTVQLITSNFPLEQLSKVSHQRTFNQSQEEQFMVKWINQLNKWEMGTIQEVTQAMESSSFMNGSVSKSIVYSE